MRCVEMHELKDACENPQHDARECRREPIGNSQGNISGNVWRDDQETQGNSRGMHRECTGHARHEEMQRCNRLANTHIPRSGGSLVLQCQVYGEIHIEGSPPA